MNLDRVSLCAITPDGSAAEILAFVAALLGSSSPMKTAGREGRSAEAESSVLCVQLRAKSVRRGELLDLADELRVLTSEAGAMLIINDHADLALLAHADGVHLGADDMPVMAARRVVGAELLIGATAPTVEGAVAAVAAGADYLGCGPVFGSVHKPDKPAIGPVRVAAVQAAVSVPVFAIGGIDESNVTELHAAGVHRAAVIGALATAADPAAAARRMVRSLVAGSDVDW